MKLKKLSEIVLLDVVFVSISYILGLIATKMIRTEYNKLLEIDIESVIQKTNTEINRVSESMSHHLSAIVTVAIIFAIIIITNWSFFQYMVYSKILDKKHNSKQFFKFLGLNFAWAAGFASIMFVIQKGAQIYLLYTLNITMILLFAYYTNILYISFFRKSVKKTLKIGFYKFHKQAIPYIIMAAILYSLVKISSIFPYSHFLIKALMLIIAITAIDFTRIYIAKSI
ncbi:MAG: hypothetical protein ABIC04_03415 [Nanoarchaeota archaeon]